MNSRMDKYELDKKYIKYTGRFGINKEDQKEYIKQIKKRKMIKNIKKVIFPMMKENSYLLREYWIKQMEQIIII